MMTIRVLLRHQNTILPVEDWVLTVVTDPIMLIGDLDKICLLVVSKARGPCETETEKKQKYIIYLLMMR